MSKGIFNLLSTTHHFRTKKFIKINIYFIAKCIQI